MSAVAFMFVTVARLNHRLFDRARAAGVMTEDRSQGERALRRVFFLLDPQRRSGYIGPLTNPVMVKEFRSRRFGRSHWMLRLTAACAVASLGLSCIAVTGILDWGLGTIGGILVLLQVALLILLTPILATGLISAEREMVVRDMLQMSLRY